MKRNNIIVDSISVKNNIVEYKFHVSKEIQKYFDTDVFWIEYMEDMTYVPASVLSISFVGTFMAFSWVTNSVIWVKDLDKTFYNSIHRIKQAYQDIYYHFPFLGRVVPSIISMNNMSKRKDLNNDALLLFSGGADAHSSFLRNLDKNPILFNIQGWYDSLLSIDSVAEADKSDISIFANKMNVKSSHVRSNFAKVISREFDKKFQSRLGDTWWHGFVHSMAFISIAIPYAFKNNVPEIIIASSLTTGLNHLCASNSTTDSEFCYAGTGYTLHDGFELNRQDKIHIICEYQKKIKAPYPIRVCSFRDCNCCECEKCFRTVLGIVAETANPNDFGFYFSCTLKEHWQDVMTRRIAMMGFGSEQVIHWPHIKRRMIENYNQMTEEQKEFVDWFLTFDFNKEKRKAVRKYYLTNCFSIIKRKLLSIK